MQKITLFNNWKEESSEYSNLDSSIAVCILSPFSEFSSNFPSIFSEISSLDEGRGHLYNAFITAGQPSTLVGAIFFSIHGGSRCAWPWRCRRLQL